LDLHIGSQRGNRIISDDHGFFSRHSLLPINESHETFEKCSFLFKFKEGQKGAFYEVSFTRG
jgi:hypothetical protein